MLTQIEHNGKSKEKELIFDSGKTWDVGIWFDVEFEFSFRTIVQKLLHVWLCFVVQLLWFFGFKLWDLSGMIL